MNLLIVCDRRARENGGIADASRTAQSDSMSAAVTLLGDRDEFTARYKGLLGQYGLRASHRNVGRGNAALWFGRNNPGMMRGGGRSTAVAVRDH